MVQRISDVPRSGTGLAKYTSKLGYFRSCRSDFRDKASSQLRTVCSVATKDLFNVSISGHRLSDIFSFGSGSRMPNLGHYVVSRRSQSQSDV